MMMHYCICPVLDAIRIIVIVVWVTFQCMTLGFSKLVAYSLSNWLYGFQDNHFSPFVTISIYFILRILRKHAVIV
jgi:hypothetical protein